MPKKYTDEEYAALLPKKQVGVAVLLFNSKNELLIVKPDYREGWLVPGGVTDEDESPLHSAIRETKEEIGLDITDLRLVGVHYRHKKGVFMDSLKFIYSGGTLTEEQILQITLQTSELEEWKFSPPEEALTLLTSGLEKSVPTCLDAIKNNSVAYIESGSAIPVAEK